MGLATIPIGESRYFRSFGEFLECAACVAPGYQPAALWSRSPEPGGGQSVKSWSGTDSFEEAMAIARKGWNEGRDRIKSESFKHNLDLGRMHRDYMPVHDTTGESVDVGRYLENDPECMIALPDTQKQGRGRTIEILYNLTTCCNQCSSLTCFVENPPGHSVTLRGLATMMLVHRLEEEGFMVELFGCIAVRKGPRNNLSEHGYFCAFPIQRAGDVVDLDQTAFILMHPSAFRRLGLSVIENLFDITPKTSSEYGAAIHAPADSDIYIPAQSVGFSTFEQAKEWVERQIGIWKQKHPEIEMNPV